MRYEVCVLGYDRDGKPDGYEREVASFAGEADATWFASNREFAQPAGCEHACVVVELREDDGSFVDQIAEIWVK